MARNPLKVGDVVTRKLKSLNKYPPICVVQEVLGNTVPATAYPMNKTHYSVLISTEESSYERTIVARKGLDKW